jgi:hypothetical protein
MAVLRGVESGFSLARASRGGMVSANDSRGRKIAAGAAIHGQDAVVLAELPLGTGRTLYTRGGDWFGTLCVIFTILLMLRLAVSIATAERRRRLGALKRIKPAGVVSVDLGNPADPVVAANEEEERIYRPPARRPGQS